MNKSRNSRGSGSDRLNARSLVLSVLLGGHPPRLPMTAVLAVGELFGFTGGTIRTAVSRMVAAGELDTADGSVRLAGRLLDRQRRQDLGRRPAPEPWNGEWWMVVAEADARSMAERRAFRAELTTHRFGELRPDTWLRPANLASPPRVPGVVAVTGRLDVDDLDRLVGRLWPRGELAAEAERLRSELDRLDRGLTGGPDTVIPEAFAVSAEVVRFLMYEPQLPAALVPQPWPADELRTRYDRFEERFQSRLRAYLATAAGPIPEP